VHFEGDYWVRGIAIGMVLDYDVAGFIVTFLS